MKFSEKMGPNRSAAQTIHLRHDRTEAEERFTTEFILFLHRLGYSGEVHCRAFIANSDGEFRRPDFYLPRYGLPIEIDGQTRHSWETRQNDISDRDAFYISMGLLPPLILDSTWTVSSLKMDRFKAEFVQMLHERRLTPKKRGLIKKKISNGRKVLARTQPGIFNSHGTEAPTFLAELGFANVREFRHFGGTRIVLRGEYQTRTLKRNKDLLAVCRERCERFDLVETEKIERLYKNAFSKPIGLGAQADLFEDFILENNLDYVQFIGAIGHFKGLHNLK